jgi:ABC-type uncharacterized transport system substrate-binding protein
MRRREFLGVLGGAAAVLPLAVHAQQPVMPVIGVLLATTIDAYRERMRGFRQGLKDTGYAEGDNVAVLYRFAENQIDRLPELVAELVDRRVAVIATFGGPAAALAGKSANTTIPIVFVVPEDPVRLGLVASIARPGGNLTGINFFVGELVAKRLELLRELVPGATRVAVLVNAVNAETTVRDVEAAARAMSLQIRVFSAGTSREIDAAFATMGRERPDALFVGGDPFFSSRRVQLATMAAHHSMPMVYGTREFAEVGGLMSYGPNQTDTYRQAGVYAGRILKGMKPAEMPVTQVAKFELVINAQTARMLGLTIPPSLLARADEVIE